jgi:hypothetical protein
MILFHDGLVNQGGSKMDESFYVSAPLVTERACGGWLATSPVGSGFSFGVTADTEAEVRTAYQAALTRWVEITSVGAPS